MGTIIIFKLKDWSKIIFFLWTSYVLEKENVKKKNCNWVNFFTFLFVSFIEVGIDLKKKKITLIFYQSRNIFKFFYFFICVFYRSRIRIFLKKLRSSFLKLILNYTIIYSYNYCAVKN